MKQYIFLALAVLAAAVQQASAVSPVGNAALTIARGNLEADFDVDVRSLAIKSGDVVLLRPMVVNGSDTLCLPVAGFYGRTSWIQRQRGVRQTPYQVDEPVRARNNMDSYRYHAEVPYQAWFDGAELSVVSERYGCAACGKGATTDSNLAGFTAPRFSPDGMYIFMDAEVDTVKIRQLSGRANVEFPVNRIILLDNFRGNAVELAAVRASVDSVRNDKDVTLRSMAFKGFASPEGPYDNNVRLAKGRTLALKDYVDKQYLFPDSLVTTSYEAEDWEGLLHWVENSSIANRFGILEVIKDNSLDPDDRDRMLKTRFPEEYAMLLADVYPTLRHTDYRIEYTVRAYHDPKEILEVMRTRPENLSLNEFFAAARSLEPGSPLYYQVYETAVKIYPNSEVANINAANNAMQRGLYDSAEAYLNNAGNSGEANYARGLLAMLRTDYDSARRLLTLAKNAGINRADDVLSQIDALSKFKNIVNY